MDHWLCRFGEGEIVAEDTSTEVTALVIWSVTCAFGSLFAIDGGEETGTVLGSLLAGLSLLLLFGCRHAARGRSKVNLPAGWLAFGVILALELYYAVGLNMRY